MSLSLSFLCCAQWFTLMDWIFGTLRVPDKEKFV
jgi:hypothetical protein